MMEPEIEQYLRDHLHYSPQMIALLKRIDQKMEEMDKQGA